MELGFQNGPSSNLSFMNASKSARVSGVGADVTQEVAVAVDDRADAPITRRAHCAKCGGIRNCLVHGEYQETQSDGHYDWWADWRILQCRGCDYCFIEKSSSDSESYYWIEEKGEQEMNFEETIVLWPALNKRARPEWFSDGSVDAPQTNELSESLLELYHAVDNELLTLSSMGVRICFDVASGILGIGEELSFNDKLSELTDKGLVSPDNQERMRVIVDAGGASAHGRWNAQPSDLEAMVDILEHFIYEAFVAPARRKALDAKAAKVRESVPARLPRPKKVKALPST